MNLSESVYEISESFMKDPDYVFMNDEEIGLIANDMKLVGKPNFPLPEVDNLHKAVVLELVAASINYCYWYGRHDVRPNGSSSTRMYELLMTAFNDYEEWDIPVFARCIENLIELLSINRFPLIEERSRHLRELVNNCEGFANMMVKADNDINGYMYKLIETFPGFASDIFLKRASLFFIQLFRRFGWFEAHLHNLHVPADYQVPKMLNHFGCIMYEEELQYAIDTNQLIPKHSQAECEIRAATVLTIKKLCGLTGWNVAEVDGYFFTKRHDATNPFHLTITTDY